MRLLFAAIILTLLSQSAWAKARSLDENSMKGNFKLRTICVDRYKFVVGSRIGMTVPTYYSDLTMVQFYEERNGVALPAKC